MEAKDLKVYRKYKYNNSTTEYIYIGKDKDNDYIFIYKEENSFISNPSYFKNNFNFDKIVKDLNLELDEKDRIKDYNWNYFCKAQLKDFKEIKSEENNNSDELKLYGRYKYNNSEIEYIYIGKDKEGDYIFLYKEENKYTPKEFNDSFDCDQIVKDLNLELDEDGDIKNYNWNWFDYTHLQDFTEIKSEEKKKLVKIIF